MPTLLITLGFRFFFFSNENNEPAHVHMEKDKANGKIWLEPTIRVAYFINFSAREQQQILPIVMTNAEYFKQKWNEYFAK